MVAKIFLVFLKAFFSPRLQLFIEKYSKNSNTMK